MSTHKWATEAASPAILKEGQLAQEPYHAPLSRVAEAAIRAGLLVQRGTTPDKEVKPIALLAVDDDAIDATIASAASAAYHDNADFAGAIGQGEIFPAQALSFTFDASGDWDPTTGIVKGIDADGNVVSECVPIATSTVYYTSNCFKRVLSFWIPAQTGAGGVCKIGIDYTYGMAVSPKDSGVAVYDRAREPSATTTVTFDALQTLAVLQAGVIAVTTEAAVVPGDPVGVRFVLSGTDVRGQFTKYVAGTPGSMELALLTGARWLTTTAADAIGLIEIGG